jgi:transposase
MLKVSYTVEAQERISQLRYHYPDPRIQKRFGMLWLHACGLKVPEIARLTQTNPSTVRGIIKKYRDGSIEDILTINYYRPKNSLEQYKTSLIEEFTKRPPSSSKEAAYRIQQLFGVERSPQRVRIFMQKLGMKFRRTGSVPAKANLDKQEEFKKNVRTRNFKGSIR